MVKGFQGTNVDNFNITLFNVTIKDPCLDTKIITPEI